jgi:predicted transcriptional regulator
MSISDKIENIIIDTVKSTLTNRTCPELPVEYIATDNIGEVVEKLCILHIRTWFLEDAAGQAKSDEELANIKRKIDICFKQKRPQYVQAINRLIDDAIRNGRSLSEDSVKLYKGIE